MARILLPPRPVSWLLQIETGVGKTEVAIRATANAVKAGMSVVYAVPRHNLGDELSRRFAAAGVAAQAYRGYEAADPASEDKSMCLDLAALRDARQVGLPVFSTVCERHGGQYQCSLLGQCGMSKQWVSRPDLWVVPHALLFHPRPEFIRQPDALVIDERFYTGAIPNEPAKLTVDSLDRSDATVPDDDAERALLSTSELKGYRAALARAVRAHRVGPLVREILEANGITFEAARAAHRLEWKRFVRPPIFPGMAAVRRSQLVEKTAPTNNQVLKLVDLWRELIEFFLTTSEQSGRLRLAFDSDTQALLIEQRSLSRFHQDWQAPSLILDATAPAVSLLEPIVGHEVVLKESIPVRWSPHGRTRQIIGAPVSASKLGIVKGKDDGKPDARIISDLRRFIVLRAAVAWPGVVAVVGQKALVEKLRTNGLPPNVEVGHFGALTGLDLWKSAAGMICVGRSLPAPQAMETAAAVVLGHPVRPVEALEGFAWYARTSGGIRLPDGSAVHVHRYEHPDPVAEALRWQSCEGEIIQAAGRLRPLRRAANNPYFLDIVSDVPLPLIVDAVETWDSALPGRWALMADDGVILQSPSDIMAAWPSWGLSRDQARAMSDPTMGVTSIKNFYIDVCPIVNRFTYKPAGRNSQTSGALVLPNGPDSLKDWLEERLGDIDWVRREEPAEPVYPANDNEEGLQRAA